MKRLLRFVIVISTVAVSTITGMGGCGGGNGDSNDLNADASLPVTCRHSDNPNCCETDAILDWWREYCDGYIPCIFSCSELCASGSIVECE